MSAPADIERRALLQRILLGLSLSSIARAAPLPALSEQDPAAKAVRYVEDAARTKDAPSGAACANCSIYAAQSDSQGSCTLFKGKSVKAAGWCSAWSGL
jgi:High potential iron-sulfur protein